MTKKERTEREIRIDNLVETWGYDRAKAERAVDSYLAKRDKNSLNS